MSHPRGKGTAERAAGSRANQNSVAPAQESSRQEWLRWTGKKWTVITVHVQDHGGRDWERKFGSRLLTEPGMLAAAAAAAAAWPVRQSGRPIKGPVPYTTATNRSTRRHKPDHADADDEHHGDLALLGITAWHDVSRALSRERAKALEPAVPGQGRCEWPFASSQRSNAGRGMRQPTWGFPCLSSPKDATACGLVRVLERAGSWGTGELVSWGAGELGAGGWDTPLGTPICQYRSTTGGGESREEQLLHLPMQADGPIYEDYSPDPGPSCDRAGASNKRGGHKEKGTATRSEDRISGVAGQQKRREKGDRRSRLQVSSGRGRESSKPPIYLPPNQSWARLGLGPRGMEWKGSTESIACCGSRRGYYLLMSFETDDGGHMRL
ncbi:hypothetical protein CIB48_g9662 [Xylaria polymorpha]|nr:hypothetical protein CIB48_g9662 [Xylaria polymorpha]